MYSGRRHESICQIVYHYHHHADIRYGSQHTGFICTCRRRNLYQSSRCGCRPCRQSRSRQSPKDDPRNPATIADNVGDNVGDVAGMGADLYESYCGSILATAALGAAAYIGTNDTTMQFKAVIAPMLIAAVGILLSIIGIFSVRTKENAGMKELLGSLAVGTNLSSALIVVATFLILWILNLQNWVNISFAVVIGLIVGIIIGRSTEYYTSQSYKPTQRLAESGKTGPATVIISGIGLGMVSTTIPVLAVVVGIILSYWLASGFDFVQYFHGTVWYRNCRCRNAFHLGHHSCY